MSWVYYPEQSDFPIENLPYGVFSRKVPDPWKFKEDKEKKNKSKKKKSKESKKDKKEKKTVSFKGNPNTVGVRIGDVVLDLKRLSKLGFFDSNKELSRTKCFEQPTLNAFMALDSATWQAARKIITNLLSRNTPTLRDDSELRKHVLVPVALVDMHLPANIGDYTDFYASMDHAANVSEMFRGARDLLPNWKYLPVGYHGRASSVVVSGGGVRRPSGQSQDPTDDKKAVFGPSKLLDFELEVGCFVGGQENPLGTPVSIEHAQDRLFGVVILNDWSARDIQKWEYVPLGPFGAKNFCTSISPWVVTFEALKPFVCAPVYPQVPEPFPYLKDENYGNYDLSLTVKLKTAKADSFQTISTSNMKYLYWTFKQQLVHHSVTGCNMRAGDLLGSGTISGAKPEERGCMLELSWAGKNPIKLESGEERKFLQDGDTVLMEGHAQGKGFRIGFGGCEGVVLPVNKT